MTKTGGFQADLAAMEVEMQNVAKILEATRTKPVEKAVEVSLQEGPANAPAERLKPVVVRPKRRSSVTPQRTVEAPPARRENVTTRLNSETNQLLTEAALRQKLKRASPNTRQDIVETAVCEWLKRQGYDRRQRPLAEGDDALREEASRGVDDNEDDASETDPLPAND